METKREWWNRPMFTRTLERCNECGELREDVKEREYHLGFTMHEAVCCPECFAELSNNEFVVC